MKLLSGNPKDCLRRVLNFCQQRLIIVLIQVNSKRQLKFDGSCLKQWKVTLTHKQVVKIYLWPFNIDKKLAIGNSLIGAVKLTENANPEK